MRHPTLLSRLAAVLMIALPGAQWASAETSSWVGGPAEPAPATKKKTEPKTAPVKIIKTVPGTPNILPTIAPPAAPNSQAAPLAPSAPAGPAPANASPAPHLRARDRPARLAPPGRLERQAQ